MRSVGHPLSVTRPEGLFVYGTLMSGEVNAGLFARQPARVVCAARVAGRLFDSGLGYPAMCLPRSPDEAGSVVLGECLVFEDLEALLPALDALEECFGPEHPDSLYHRVVVSAMLPDGSTRAVWAYVAARSGLLVTPIPRGDWRAYRSTRPGVGAARDRGDNAEQAARLERAPRPNDPETDR